MISNKTLQLNQPANLNDAFPPEDFDEWADKYDRDVLRGGFPFDGYSQVLETTLRLAEAESGQSILDLGVGTGNLSKLFSQRGCLIYGLDYSARMLELARRKLPEAVLLKADLRQDLPGELDCLFDCIVSAYVFHHFELRLKITLIVRLMQFLKPHGRMVISDLAFADRSAMQAIRLQAGLDWEEEFYWIADETLPKLARAGLPGRFEPVSSCAGVFVIPRL